MTPLDRLEIALLCLLAPVAMGLLSWLFETLTRKVL